MHEELIAEHGGLSGVRDELLLSSALARAQNLHAYENADVYRLAATYGFGIARNHPFADGNKRTALMAIYTFLGLNGVSLTATEDEAVETILSLATGDIGEAELGAWIRAHSSPSLKGGD